MTSTTTTTHLQISSAEQATPTTRQTPMGYVAAGGYSFENDLTSELEEIAVRRLRDLGRLVDATEVLPELAE